ncbi:hypothetical protein ACFP51_28850 [Streptomyces pratens]|uniref:Uncharacterized protein n=1 Tax=Streptomyces pratens TaxID=887456 RepID=A0ABW1M5I8_9ACTN
MRSAAILVRREWGPMWAAVRAGLAGRRWRPGSGQAPGGPSGNFRGEL